MVGVSVSVIACRGTRLQHWTRSDLDHSCVAVRRMIPRGVRGWTVTTWTLAYSAGRC